MDIGFELGILLRRRAYLILRPIERKRNWREEEDGVWMSLCILRLTRPSRAWRRRHPDRLRAGARRPCLGAGHNKRVQQGDPILHAEIDCLRRAGRVGYYGDTTLYSTLMPCYLCAGAAVQFGIKRVIVGESETFTGAREFMESHGIEVVDLALPECTEMMAAFIAANPSLWSEDIGALTGS